MADISLEYLAALPTPEVLETYSFETILARRKAEMAGRAPAYGFAYDVGGLESDPGVVLLEEASYEEILLRERGNAIARARYLYFARGAEIDHRDHSARRGVERALPAAAGRQTQHALAADVFAKPSIGVHSDQRLGEIQVARRLRMPLPFFDEAVPSSAVVGFVGHESK